MISSSCLANSSTLCLKFSNRKSFIDCLKFLKDAIKLDYHEAPINRLQITRPLLESNHILFDFWSSYAFQMLLTLGDRIRCQMTSEIFHKINTIIIFIRISKSSMLFKTNSYLLSSSK